MKTYIAAVKFANRFEVAADWFKAITENKKVDWFEEKRGRYRFVTDPATLEEITQVLGANFHVEEDYQYGIN